MKKIGEEIKKTRNEKGLSLKDIYQKTKIHPDIIKSIEDGTIGEKMHPIYAKGFLKTYSQCLGLDSADIITKYSVGGTPKSQAKEKREPLEVLPKVAFKVKINTDKILLYAKPLGLLLVSLLTVLALIHLMTGTIGLIKSAFKPRQSSERRVTIKASALKSAEAPQVKKSISRDQKKVTVPKVLSNQKTSSVRATAIKKITTSNKQAQKPVSLLIRTTDDVWMKVRADEEVIFHDILPKGRSELWRADKKIDLWVGKAEAIRLKLNGKNMGSPGYGVIKNIEVSSEGVFVNGKLINQATD